MMKKVIAGLLLVVMGCQVTPDNVGPDLLFRTWQVVADGAKPPQYPIQVEFTRSGTLLYGKDKQTGWCCSPSRFEASGSQIEFLWAETPDPQCELVDCMPSVLAVGLTWNIEKLTSSELILTAGSRRLVFN